MNQVGNHNCCFRRSAAGVSKLDTSLLPSIQQIRTSFFLSNAAAHPSSLVNRHQLPKESTVEWCKEDRINRMYSSIFLSATIFSWTQALKGQDFPIPKEDLYEDYRSKVTDAECQTPKENSTKVDWRKCMDENDITLDYTCRFSLLSFDCYCCGAFFHYTEHGKICTRY